MPKTREPGWAKNVALSPMNMQHAALGAALHGMSVDDYFNEVVSTWIVAANGVLLSQPPREGIVLSKMLTPQKK